MLFSLIAVLVLMVVAFFSLWMAATGRVSGAEGPELSLGGRVLLTGAALVAFGLAYAVYHPQRDAQPAVLDAAMSSTPPDSRGAAVAPTPPAETPQATATSPAPNTEKIREPVEESNGLSASALLLEAAELERRAVREPAPATTASKSRLLDRPAVITTAAPRTPLMPVAAAPRRAKALMPSRPRASRGPLLVHVHNRLGPDQQSEQLSLSIEGLRVADIELDGSRPAVAVAVALPRAGLLHYRLEGRSQDRSSTRLLGEGCIRVSDDAHFSVRRKEGSRKVFLEALQVAR